MTDIVARRLEMLGEFAELLLVTARDLHQRGLAADDNEESARLADSLHRTGRGLRQTLALHARLERDAKRGAVEDQVEARAETRRAVEHRRKQLATTVERLIWTEREQEDAEDLADQLETLLDAEELEDGFATQPLDQLITHICNELGLERSSPGTGEMAQVAQRRGSMGEVKQEDFPHCRPPIGLGDISPVPGEDRSAPHPSG